MESDAFYLRRCNEVSKESIEHGNTPFGAVLVDVDGNILMEQENVEITSGDCTGHAETTLMARASRKYDKDFLSKCSLYSSFEPCAMCSGAIYWGNVRRLVYGASETTLLDLTGDNPQNPTMSLSCREVFAAGQKDIEVVGPFPELEEELMEVHKGYWK